MFSKFVAHFGRELYSRKYGRSAIRLALRSGMGRRAAIHAISRQSAPDQRILVRKLVELAKPETQLQFAENARKIASKNNQGQYLDIYWLILASSAAVESAWELLSDPDATSHIRGPNSTLNRVYAQAITAFELARYKDAVAAFLKVQDREPDELRLNHDYLKAAYSASKVVDKDLALQFFARQYVKNELPKADPEPLLRHFILQRISHDTLTTLSPHLASAAADQKQLRIGVFFLSSTEALGHAILDPYHFLALHRRRFDKIFFIGPARASYRPGSRTCIDIVDHFGAYLETASDPLLNLSWMGLGSFEIGPLDFQIQVHRGQDENNQLSWSSPRKRTSISIELVVEHYWSLLREVVHRSLDPEDGFRHNAWHLDLPRSLEQMGTEFCHGEGIDLEKPFVVLHARDRHYHNIGKQSYRDADIRNYIPAIQHLLKAGYQVLRIGDESISRLPIESDSYYELPFMDFYGHHLDPFFISRARFMMGCQSGPCAYARAFGVPLLSVNAILHYTLLPAPMEMACFKRYFRADGKNKQVEELDIEQALEAGVAHFDNSHQFNIARIELRDASSEEILASVQDMIDWLDKPSLRETALQKSFRKAVARHAAKLAKKGYQLDLPIGNFLGIALPGYRLSPTVAAMRQKQGPSAAKARRPAGTRAKGKRAGPPRRAAADA
ncbi:MAG TPA: TIGR04372 family glycosyltransferase [Rhizobiales bacterium]|nr:TIGR04372 family glycosyltransferase [Hyphomicrobiales bacterium]